MTDILERAGVLKKTRQRAERAEEQLRIHQVALNHEQRRSAALTDEIRQLRQVRVDAAALKAGKPMSGFESLQTQTQWEIAFGTALLAVEKLFIEAMKRNTDEPVSDRHTPEEREFIEALRKDGEYEAADAAENCRHILARMMQAQWEADTAADKQKPDNCSVCRHVRINEHDMFGAIVRTPTCGLTTERGGAVCPHDWNRKEGLRIKLYRPDWCPLDKVATRQKD